MNNPWNEIKLTDYENHMKMDSVMQLQTLNKMMKRQFDVQKATSILILGVAGGNGLEHIDTSKVKKLYAIDVNMEYLNICKNRYPMLDEITTYLCGDLLNENLKLPQADLVVANLFIEYIGYECFATAINKISPKAVSCVIQVNRENGFVSDSPYLHVFDELSSVHHEMKEEVLAESLQKIGFKVSNRFEETLPNGKALIQMDFISK